MNVLDEKEVGQDLCLPPRENATRMPTQLNPSQASGKCSVWRFLNEASLPPFTSRRPALILEPAGPAVPQSATAPSIDFATSLISGRCCTCRFASTGIDGRRGAKNYVLL